MTSFARKENDGDAQQSPLPRFASWREAFTHVDRIISVTTPALKVSVSEPEVSGNMLLGKHVTYLIRTEPFGYVVRRRFSDFCWLRETLAKRYIGMLVPSLPKKSVIGASMSNIGSEFIKNRMRLLGLFVENLVQIPFVRSDAALLAFLSIQNEKDWDKSRSHPDIVRDMYSDTSVGCVKWRQLVSDDTQVVAPSERAIQDVWKQIERVEQTLSPLCSACKQLSERTAAVATDMAQLRNGFNEWNKVETEFMNPSRWEYPTRENAQLSAMLAQSTTLLENWCRVLEYQPLIFEHVCHDALQYLEQQADAFREMLRAREKVVKEKAKFERELQGQLAERGRSGAKGEHGNSSSTSSSTSSSSSILGSFSSLTGTHYSEDDLARMIKERENAIKAYTRALFFCEIDRFNADRAAVTRAVMSQLAACTVQLNKKANTLWSDAVSSMGLDVEGGVEASKAIMASTSAVKLAGANGTSSSTSA